MPEYEVISYVSGTKEADTEEAVWADLKEGQIDQYPQHSCVLEVKPAYSNEDRAERGKQALILYTQLPHMSSDQGLVDLLADLMHMVDQENNDNNPTFAEALTMADMHFKQETWDGEEL
jgi:hypothetical protein